MYGTKYRIKGLLPDQGFTPGIFGYFLSFAILNEYSSVILQKRIISSLLNGTLSIIPYKIDTYLYELNKFKLCCSSSLDNLVPPVFTLVFFVSVKPSSNLHNLVIRTLESILISRVFLSSPLEVERSSPKKHSTS